jgi:hypothetical protein
LRLSPFRAWPVLAIPIALLCAESISSINGFLKSLAKSLTKDNKVAVKIISIIFLIVILYGVAASSFTPKYRLNTVNWPPGAFWASFEEIGGYVWMKENLAKNSNVFTFVNNGPVIGMDMFTCHWCQDIRDFQRSGFNQSVEQNYGFLKSKSYSYIIIDGQTVKKFGINESNEKIQGYVNSGKFKPVYSNQGFIIFSIL